VALIGSTVITFPLKKTSFESGQIRLDKAAKVLGAARCRVESEDSKNEVQVPGTISETGKTFVSERDGKSWTILNPDAVKGHEGHHVILTANF
jgi:hypothetical protein